MKHISKALSEFRRLLPAVAKDARNPHFNSSYASLANILEEAAGPLEKSGLSFVQYPNGRELVTTIVHIESGESISGTLPLNPAKDDPQGIGSALTYTRRYALVTMLGLAMEDDDGNAASKPKPAAMETKGVKECNKCGKPHMGQYPTCIDCYMKSKRNP